MKYLRFKNAVIAIITIINMAIALTSCSDEPTYDSLIGEWETTNFDEYFRNGENRLNSIVTNYAVQFTKDGKFIEHSFFDGQWHYVYVYNYVPIKSDEKGRMILKVDHSEVTCWFEGSELHMKTQLGVIKFKATSGIAEQSIEYLHVTGEE